MIFNDSECVQLEKNKKPFEIDMFSNVDFQTLIRPSMFYRNRELVPEFVAAYENEFSSYFKLHFDTRNWNLSAERCF